MPTLRIESHETHPKGVIYRVDVAGRSVAVLVTKHAEDRRILWNCTEHRLFETLLFAEEVLIGHRDRFIAHRRYGEHVLRVVYEYEGDLPLVVTLYFPYVDRYFEGGGSYADQVLS